MQSQHDEHVAPTDYRITTVRHHWAIFVPPLITAVVGFGLVGYSELLSILAKINTFQEFVKAIIANPAGLFGVMGLLLIAYAAVGGIIATLKYMTTRIVLDHKQVSWQTGLISDLSDSILLTRIESVQAYRPVMGRVFGWMGLGDYGTVQIRGVGVGSPLFDVVNNPFDLRDKIYEQTH